MMLVYKRFSLECAHWLPNVPDDHKCKRLHGHSYQVELGIGGVVDTRTRWIMDYADVAAAWQVVHDALDHRCLNEVPGLANPTCEELLMWIVGALRPVLNVQAIRIGETCTAGVEWRAE